MSKLAVLSLQESGTARLCFDVNNNFEGILLNDQDESFAISGHLLSSSMETSSAGHFSNDPLVFEVYITDGVTGTTYALKKVRLSVNSSTHFVSLQSEAIRFETEEILVGNKADIEIRSYLNPDMADSKHFLHVGQMSVNFQTALTPPPTPQSIASGDSGDNVMPMEEDFLK